MAHPMAAQLQGKVAIVTGAGRGIGRGIALVLAERGASVTVSDINAEAAADAAEEIGAAGGHAIAVAADVTSQDSMNEVAKRALNEFSQIDICVANAGV
ncbi:MAG: SDR family NAD(P)-dependent oxidoreductase, partial [Dehalococcoidia bacterium]